MNTAAMTSVLFYTFPFLLTTAGVMCLSEEPEVAKETGGALGNGDKAAFTTMHDLHAFAVDTQESLDDNGSSNGDHSSFHRRGAGMGHGSVGLTCNNNNDIIVCIKALEVLTSNDLGFAATIDEVNKMCPVLLDGLRCIDNYTRRCLTQKHREYFNKLYAGTITVIKDLCNTRAHYQQEYIRHAPCMRKVSPRYNQCSVIYHTKTAGLNHIKGANMHLRDAEQGKNVVVLCCSFQEYLQCSERVVYETCGNETALFTKDFLNRMAGPIVQDLCGDQRYSLSTCSSEASTSIHTSTQHHRIQQATAGNDTTATSFEEKGDINSHSEESEGGQLKFSSPVTDEGRVWSDSESRTTPLSARTLTHGTTAVSRPESSPAVLQNVALTLSSTVVDNNITATNFSHSNNSSGGVLKLSSSSFRCRQYTPGSQACEGVASALSTSPAVATFIIVLLLLIFSL